ncbi:HK97-gp10 family putative phage morphogenesis protein [Undibacterium sp.]|uniref:HK97-gp10 family putative phage morphogenesis protein n=1 Tax=Undibacterium sp. TaxID=1914977 RepID=UPI003752C9BF
MAAEKIEGLADLRKGFQSISKDMELRTSRAMVVAAGGVLKKEAKALAQQQGLRKTGALIDNIVIKREKTPEGVAQYNLGVRHGRDLGRKAKKVLTVKANGRVGTKYVNDPFYWSFLEFGRNIYKGTTTAKNMNSKRKRLRTTKNAVGRTKATPFIAPALTNKRAEAIEAMKKRLQKTLEKANR